MVSPDVCDWEQGGGEALEFKIAHEGDTAGTYTVLLDNVKITNGGSLRRMIYQDGFPSASVQAEGPTTNVAYQTMNRATSYYVVNGQRAEQEVPVALWKVGFVGDNGLKWMLSDYLGSTSVVTNASGASPATQGYMPWGETRYGSVPTSYQYTGQFNETAIGLYYYGARWYDPALGRFAQPDNIIPEASQGVQAWDRFAYVNNSPIVYNDPSGHMLDSGCNSTGCASDEEERNKDHNPVIEKLKEKHQKERYTKGNERNYPFRNSPLDPNADYWNWWIGYYGSNQNGLYYYSMVVQDAATAVSTTGAVIETVSTGVGCAAGVEGCVAGYVAGNGFFVTVLNPIESLSSWASTGITIIADLQSGQTSLNPPVVGQGTMNSITYSLAGQFVIVPTLVKAC